jgi:hypothetical protein
MKQLDCEGGEGGIRPVEKEISVIQQAVKSSSSILFLFVSGYFWWLLFARHCRCLMAQIWHNQILNRL